MDKLKQVISTFFIVAMILLNLWLTFGLNRYLHAHIEGNKILIHFHNPTNHQSGYAYSGEHGGISSILNFLTYLNDSQSFKIGNNLYYYIVEIKNNCVSTYYKRIYTITYRRGPPC